MALKNRLPERMFTELLAVGERYLIGVRALSVGGVRSLAWGAGPVAQAGVVATDRRLAICSLDKLGRPDAIVASMPYTDIAAISLSRTKVAFTSIGVVELSFTDGSSFQFESTASTVDEFAELVRLRLSSR